MWLYFIIAIKKELVFWLSQPPDVSGTSVE
jgi:hypothetical protein